MACRFLSRVALAAVWAALSVSASLAATVSENDIGDFSGDWRSETVITGAPDVITGTWSGGNDYDLLWLTGLDSGAQELTLTFSVPEGTTLDYGFAAGGSVLYKTSGYQWSAWEGKRLGKVKMNWRDPSDDILTLRLGDRFDGNLHLGLYNTFGTVSYTVSGMRYRNAVDDAPLPSSTPAVPLPAPVLMLGAGIGALGALRMCRRG